MNGERYFVLARVNGRWETHEAPALSVAELSADLRRANGIVEVVVVKAVNAVLEPEPTPVETQFLEGFAPAPLQVHFHLNGLTTSEIVQVVRELQATNNER